MSEEAQRSADPDCFGHNFNDQMEHAIDHAIPAAEAALWDEMTSEDLGEAISQMPSFYLELMKSKIMEGDFKEAVSAIKGGVRIYRWESIKDRAEAIVKGE